VTLRVLFLQKQNYAALEFSRHPQNVDPDKLTPSRASQLTVSRCIRCAQRAAPAPANRHRQVLLVAGRSSAYRAAKRLKLRWRDSARRPKPLKTSESALNDALRAPEARRSYALVRCCSAARRGQRCYPLGLVIMPLIARRRAALGSYMEPILRGN